MAFSPFARFRNFTLDNLKALLDVYPDMMRKMTWNESSDVIEEISKGYKKTAYQQACQFGLEDRSADTYRVQNYLYSFDDNNLMKYIKFWLKVYYAPNPYVNSNDTPILIYCELAKAVLSEESKQLDFYDFFNDRIGGKSDDILLNAMKTYAEPLKYKKVGEKHIFYVEEADVPRLLNEVQMIEKNFAIGDFKSRAEFFERFTYEKFCDFYGISCDVEENEDVLDDKTFELNFNTNYTSIYAHNRILFGAPGTGKSYTLNTDKNDLLGEDSNNYERVTFHPNFSYANFVGTYKPIMVNSLEKELDAEKREVISILADNSKTAQNRYDLLYNRFNGDGLTRLPLLLGLCSDDSFKTKKQDGTDAVGDNSVERNHGKYIRPYVQLRGLEKTTSEIAYEYVPGPFMRILVKALKNARTSNPKPYLLIIEEINRANVAAVFGEVFQLLDRNENGVSEYSINVTEDIKNYLAKPKNLGGRPSDYEKIKIPNNMYIWATMNSADQGVFPMDTAFKRRWEFEYIGVNQEKKEVENYIIPIGDKDHRKFVKWNDLREHINDILSSDDCKVNEDKLLGPFFMSKNMLEGACDNQERFVKAFESKVIMYLFEDAMKMRPANIFKGHKGKMIFSEICKTLEEKREGLFGISDVDYIEREEQE